MSGNFEVMPVGTAARLAELEAENKGLRFALSRQGKSTMPEMVALRADVERLRALNGELLEALRKIDNIVGNPAGGQYIALSQIQCAALAAISKARASDE